MTRVYCCDLTDTDYDSLFAQASQGRQKRALACRYREDALACVAAEALLRKALPEADLSQMTKEGKPALPGICFNLSHSGHWVVLAVGDQPVGIDVECPKPGRDWQRLAARYFTPEEQSFAQENQTRFLQVWTGKESYLKYTGEGLRRPLQSFSIFDPALPPMRTWELPGAVMTLCAQEPAENWEIVQL